jgi:hypothetical protein
VESIKPLAHDDAAHVARFANWVDQLHRGSTDPQMRLEPMPSPSRLAPYADAITTELITEQGAELASGRMVFLFNPEEVKEWDGDRRCVIFARSALEPEIANDPLASEVGWSWLLESLAATGAEVKSLSGTVTRTSSESFGTLADRGALGVIEIRASWSPCDDDMAPHGASWTRLLRMAAGMPLEIGVTHLPPRDRA